MPTLEDDSLIFRFPHIDPGARLAIGFQRTLRIPDSGRDYPLPPGFGHFPLRHVEDHAARLPAETVRRGGVILPMWQAEALWIDFSTGSREVPVAVKIAAGKVNAVTGEAWRPGLHRNPQDYVVTPDQPWLDGFAVERGIIRQFVAMPLGEGYSVEEQVTGAAEWGGLQILAVPLKAHVWRALQAEREASAGMVLCESPMLMGLGAGGRMRQEIEPDRFRLSDWDIGAAQRVFVTILHAKDWKAVTGEAAPTHPPSAQDYAQAGLPWFEHYGRGALPGGRFGGVRSVGALHKAKTGAPLPGSQDVATGPALPLGPGAPRPVRSGDW